MALGDKTQEYLNESASALRNALYWAAKNERPHTIQAIAELLSAIDKVTTMDDVLDSLENMKDKWSKKRNKDDDWMVE
jgi:hypothetical protein